jgi:hypothetical protein
MPEEGKTAQAGQTQDALFGNIRDVDGKLITTAPEYGWIFRPTTKSPTDHFVALQL